MARFIALLSAVAPLVSGDVVYTVYTTSDCSDAGASITIVEPATCVATPAAVTTAITATNPSNPLHAGLAFLGAANAAPGAPVTSLFCAGSNQAACDLSVTDKEANNDGTPVAKSAGGGQGGCGWVDTSGGCFTATGLDYWYKATEAADTGGGGAPTAPAPDPCFPSSAKVTMADGRSSRVDSLKEGDKIVATTADGVPTIDTVSLLSIAKAEARAKFVVLTTAANASITLTPHHHLPVGPACCSTLKKAKDVQKDETVWTMQAGNPMPTLVTSTSSGIDAKGLHSPVLTNGGFPVVDDIITSFDSIDKVTLAKHGLTPLIASCKATGTCEAILDLFLGDDRQLIK